MMKNLLFALALLSLAMAVGCAKGGNGIVPAISVAPPGGTNASAIYPTQSFTVTATVTGTSNMAVNWSVTGGGTITPLTPLTATYVAPSAAGGTPTITATLTSDSSVTGELPLTIVDITTQISPLTPSVGSNLTQAFAATAVPNDAPQTFTWSCKAGGSGGQNCGNFQQDPTTSGLAYYTYSPADNCTGSCIVITAASTLDQNGCAANPKNCSIVKATPVQSRVSGTYGFRFSGYDSSDHAVAVIGTFTASASGNGITGTEELLTANGPSGQNPISITGGSYTPASSDPINSNNAGKLTLTLPAGIYPNQFQVVLDAAGDLEMIESDGHGAGAGIAQIVALPGVFKNIQTFAFGFNGVDAGGNRVGYAGLLPMSGSGTISSGQMDINDNGTNLCGTTGCNVTGTYTADGSISGLWHMTLTTTEPTGNVTQSFDFFISAGASGTSGKTNPLTFYAMSTDAVTTNPAVSGTMVLQDSTQTYNIAAFAGTSISALTGVDGASTVVSLIFGNTDGKGDLNGQFDQNDAGTVLSAIIFPGTSQSPSPYTYAANSSNNGRYTFNMLGNPSAKTVVAPIPFVLYASGQNRGFLLDQSSHAVMTGTMNPQGAGGGSFGTVELPGTFGAATTSIGNPSVGPIAENLLLAGAATTMNAMNVLCGNGTEPNCPLSGTQYMGNPGDVGLTGSYNLNGTAGEGVGTIALTVPATQTFAIYTLDTSGCGSKSVLCAITSFFMIDETTSNKNPAIIFAKE